VVIFGGVAEIVSASTAVAVAAVLGIGGALVIMLMGARHDPRTDVSAVTGLPSRRGDESIVPDPNGVRL
jgi:hypothetical protein